MDEKDKSSNREEPLSVRLMYEPGKNFTASLLAGKNQRWCAGLGGEEIRLRGSIALMKIFGPVSSSSLLPQLQIIAVKRHRECELYAPQLRATAIRCRAQNRRVWDHVGQTTHECASPIFPECSWKRHNAGAWEPSDSRRPQGCSLERGYFWVSADEDGVT